MSYLARVSILTCSFVLGSAAACYSVEFDAQKPDVYYCQDDDECLETQACSQFRCVDDRGPHVSISGPEPGTDFPVSTTSLEVLFDLENLTLDGSNDVVEGRGKVKLSIDPHRGLELDQLVATDEAQLSLGAGLDAGPHRLVAQAVFGDGTPYTNPSARNHIIFWSTDDTSRPQIALLEPGPHHVHVAGEPLEVKVVSRNFEFVNLGTDCPVPEGCDPFTDDTCVPTKEGCTQINLVGHTHIYMLDNYPDCLQTTPQEPISCNLDYIASIRNEGEASTQVSTVIEGDRFPEAGEFVLTAAMQYTNHAPYPNVTYIIYDQMPITIVER